MFRYQLFYTFSQKMKSTVLIMLMLSLSHRTGSWLRQRLKAVQLSSETQR